MKQIPSNFHPAYAKQNKTNKQKNRTNTKNTVAFGLHF